MYSLYMCVNDTNRLPKKQQKWETKRWGTDGEKRDPERENNNTTEKNESVVYC